MQTRGESATKTLLGLPRRMGFWLLLATLAWAPFPLGSNREWSWGLLSILIGCCWICWATGGLTRSELAVDCRYLARIWLELTLAIAVIAWGVVQAMPMFPNWAHPIWEQADSLLHVASVRTISLNPWQTLETASRLLLYISMFCLCYLYGESPARSQLLVYVVILFGTIYSCYGFGMQLLDKQQFELFYARRLYPGYLASPFVQRNNFAAYAGLASIASLSFLAARARERVTLSRGIRRAILSSARFILGSGTLLLLAAIITTSAVIATGSRGAFLSELCAILVMFCSLFLLRSSRGKREIALAGLFTVVLLGGLLFINGNLLEGRLEYFLAADNPEAMRTALWSAAGRMVISAPLFGLGLGTFEDAYPMYAQHVFPFVMDKAHSDYLEFAAGAGLPATIAWATVFVLLSLKLWRSIRNRRKDRVYGFIGLGALVLLSCHSLVDFSLQIPAIALTFSALLGVGVSQSFSSKIRSAS